MWAERVRDQAKVFAGKQKGRCEKRFRVRPQRPAPGAQPVDRLCFGPLLRRHLHAEGEPVFDLDQVDLTRGDPVELAEEVHHLCFEHEVLRARLGADTVVAAELHLAHDLRRRIEEGITLLDAEPLDAPEVDFLHLAHEALAPRRQPFVLDLFHIVLVLVVAGFVMPSPVRRRRRWRSRSGGGGELLKKVGRCALGHVGIGGGGEIAELSQSLVLGSRICVLSGHIHVA